MESIVTRLRSCIDSLGSSKVTERKKAATEIKDELIDRGDVIKALNKISKNSEEYTCTWNALFSASHGALIMEVDKQREKDKTKSQAVRENTKIIYSSLVLVVAKKANEGSAPHIKCATIIDAVIYVLESAVYRNAIGDIYLNILYENVLPVMPYWGTIKLENWTALFEVGINLFETHIPHCKTSTIIAVIDSVIKHGCEHSSLATVIKKRIFGFLKNVVQKSVGETVDFQFHAFKLLVTTCKKLRKECRMAICKFSEEIFDKLLDMGQKNIQGASGKKQYFLDFLLIAIECHHPDGVTESSNKSYAHEATDWNKRLRQLNHFSNTELESAKQKYAKTQTLPVDFVKVVVEVYNQIFRSDKNCMDVTVNQTINESFAGGDRGNGTKRRRITCGFTDLIDRLKQYPQPIDMWPWLSIISSLISTYPSLLNECDYFLLLQNMSRFLSSCKEPVVTDYLCQCCISLIGVRQNNIKITEDEEVLWDSIWNIALRTIGLNQNVEWSHKLLQHMMKYMWTPSRGSSVLKLYISHVVRLSKSSLLTLYHLRMHVAFPTAVLDVPVHSTILRWLLPVISECSRGEYFLLDLPIEYQAHMVLLCCFKNNVKKPPKSLPVLEFDSYPTSPVTATQIHGLTSCDSEIFLPSSDGNTLSTFEDSNIGCVLNDEACEQLLNLIENHTQSLLEICAALSDHLIVVQYLSSYVLFLVHVLRFGKYYEVNVISLRLTKDLRKVLTELFAISKTNLESPQNIGIRIKLLRHLSYFFQQLGILPSELVQSIADAFFWQLKPVFDIIDHPEETVGKQKDRKDVSFGTGNSLFDVSTLSDYHRLKVEACRLIVHYSFNRDHIQQNQYNVIENAVQGRTESLGDESSRGLLIMSSFCIQTVLNLKTLNADLLSITLKLIEAVCATGENRWCHLEESALAILHHLQETVIATHLIKNQDNWVDLKRFIDAMLNADRGAPVTSQAVCCLGSFLEIDAKDLSNVSDNSLNILLDICSELLKYLKNPFHEVRVTAMVFLTKIFTLLDHVTRYKQIAIRKVDNIADSFETVLRDIFLAGELTEEEKPDERTNRPLTVFYSIASAICNSNKSRRRFIFLLFCLTHEKRQKPDVASKILKLITCHLKIKDLNDFVKDNIMFVLSTWYKKYKSFENFPYQIIGCKSIEQFYKLYLKEVIVVFSFATDIDKLNEISTSLGTPLINIFKECFSEVTAIILKKTTESSLDLSDTNETKKIYDFFSETLTSELVEEMMVDRLANVLTSILRNLHDPTFDIPECSILPIPTPFVSDVNLIKKTIEYLESTAMSDKMNLLVYTACHHPKFIQKIFLNLYVDVIKATTPEIRLESLQKYILFCDLLLPHYNDLSQYKMAAFITNTIINNLLNFVSLSKASTSLVESTLKFFYKFTSEWLPNDDSCDSSEVFAECLSSIVEKLIVLVTQHHEHADMSLKILNYLLNERVEIMSSSIEKLDQFPDQSEFEGLRAAYLERQLTDDGLSLMSDVESFLKASENSPYSPCRMESLKSLRKQLIANRQELVCMFQPCATKNLLSEEYVHSMPHRLICTLVEHTRFQDEKVRYEAVCCLSEIGLVDLNTLVLRPSYNNLHDNTSTPESLITESIVTLLKDGITDENVEVVRAASQVLLMTLSSKEGFQFIKDKMNLLDKSILFPFASIFSDKVIKVDIWHAFSVDTFKECVDNEFLWCPIDDPPYSKWIGNIVCAICSSFSNTCFINALQTVCQLKVSAAEKIFKYLVNLLTSCESRNPIIILSDRINQFLESYFASNDRENLPDSYYSVYSNGKKVNSSVYTDKSSVQCLLDVANFVRLNQSEPDSNDFSVNYLLIAKAALHCSAYFTAILYTELHVNSLIKRHNIIPYDGNILEYLEEIGNNSDVDQNNLLNILREAFSKIGDSDALYGCGSSLLLRSETRILHYQQIENWPRVFESCNSNLAYNSPVQYGRINDLASAIGNSGYNYLQNQYLNSLEQLTPQLEDARYQSSWKLGKWDLVQPPDDQKTFSYYQYAAFKDIHQNNFKGAQINVENARKSLIPSIARIDLECTKNIYHVLAKLQCLQDINNFACNSPVSEEIIKWESQDGLNKRLNFNHKESILHGRVHLADTSSEEGKRFILSVAKKARKERNFNFADFCISKLQNTREDPYSLFASKVCFEEACILWDRKETYVARFVVKDLLKKEETLVADHADTFRATLLRTYGKWLSETNLENADTIFDQYFLPSSELILKQTGETEKERKVRLKMYKQVAEFADQQYQQICDYIKSDTFEVKIETVSKSKKTSDSLAASISADTKKKRFLLDKQSKIEDSEVKEIRNKEHRYMILALKYYLKVLAESEEQDLKIFRIVSFWLHQKTNLELHNELEDVMFTIPSYKFISVLPQLMAHITSDTDSCFGDLLNRLIVKCATDHPHHTLPSIFSLANYTMDGKFDKNIDSICDARGSKKPNEDRVLAAANVIEKFRTSSSKNIVNQMDLLCEAYVEFAYWKADQAAQNSGFCIPSNLAISKVVNYEEIYCPTISVPITKSLIYDDVIGIYKIKRQFVKLCGINAPKKITCKCTDGKTRDQLVKGQDDMRVDAVMQQVFTIMNTLLLENKQTSKRKLLLRTYKIVPLSQRSGVLEFCTNTISLNEYLVWRSDINKGAHNRLRPQDMTTKTARFKLAHVDKNDESRLAMFKQICSQLKPVFRYFFIEKFRLPATWYERKLAYIHSVATTSMVGYILGIGDRHVQNMLIDEKTAEIIHIDFGIAFDQGLSLNCPELVPFRLTRDMEDGMGIFSIDGIFRRCCEQVMAVLRENSEIIRTTIEVFIHDPLYMWKIPPEKRDSLQTSDAKASRKSTSKQNGEAKNKEVETNVTAARALSRLKVKLQGMEDGTPTNVEGQVNRLIQQAKDVHNLSKIFEGWQAYL